MRQEIMVSVTTASCHENDYLGEVWQLRLEDKRTIQQTLTSPAYKKSTARRMDETQHHNSSSTEYLFFLGTGGESGVHPRSLMLLAGDIETNPGPGREIDIMDSLVEHELCSEEEILDSSNDSGRGNTDTSGVDLGLLDTRREDELNESSSLSEEHRGDRTFENCSRVDNRSGREGSREKPFENGVSGEIAEINDDDLIVRATCISWNSPFRKQYSPFFCVEPGCLAICHRQEICSGLSRTGQKRGGWRCFLHGGRDLRRETDHQGTAGLGKC